MHYSYDLRGYGKDHYRDLQRDIRCFPTKTCEVVVLVTHDKDVAR